MTKRKQNFLHRHSLGIAAMGILLLWIVLYSFSDPGKHLGSFFGNAIADWSGVLVMVFATKHLYEKDSAESRRPPRKTSGKLWRRLREHSLTIFLALSGAAWVALYVYFDSESKWGQVVGNIVSEWTQIFGLVLLTKKCIEWQSKE
jgi:peptidoglycan/LPS O-acetylase OafA/YrhL